MATKKHFLQSQKTSLLYNYHTQKKMISHEAKQYFYLVYLHKIKTAFKKRGFLCGYKPLLPARVSRRCFHFVQAIAFDSRQPSKGFIFYYFFLFAFSCLYACCSASENGFAYSFTLILSIAISCISCSRIYFATVASFNPTVLT